MHDEAWWNSLIATIDGKRAHEFAQFLTDDGEFRFGNQPAVRGARRRRGVRRRVLRHDRQQPP